MRSETPRAPDHSLPTHLARATRQVPALARLVDRARRPGDPLELAAAALTVDRRGPVVAVGLDHRALVGLALAIDAVLRIDRPPELPRDSGVVLVLFGADHAERTQGLAHLLGLGPLAVGGDRDDPLQALAVAVGILGGDELGEHDDRTASPRAADRRWTAGPGEPLPFDAGLLLAEISHHPTIACSSLGVESRRGQPLPIDSRRSSAAAVSSLATFGGNSGSGPSLRDHTQ